MELNQGIFKHLSSLLFLAIIYDTTKDIVPNTVAENSETVENCLVLLTKFYQ